MSNKTIDPNDQDVSFIKDFENGKINNKMSYKFEGGTFDRLLQPIKDHCKQSFCRNCEIEKFCCSVFKHAPRYWED